MIKELTMIPPLKIYSGKEPEDWHTGKLITVHTTLYKGFLYRWGSPRHKGDIGCWYQIGEADDEGNLRVTEA
jgi:hypothetical protein